MKKWSLLLIILLFSGCAAAEYAQDKDFAIEKIYVIENKTKDNIYSLTKMWFAKEFRSANSVIQYDNKEDGVIIGKFTVKHSIKDVMFGMPMDGGYLRATLTINIKDGRVRLSIKDISVVSNPDVIKIGSSAPMYFPGGEHLPQKLDIVSGKYELEAISDSFRNFIYISHDDNNW